MASRNWNASPTRKARLHPLHCRCRACTAASHPMRNRSTTIQRMQVAALALAAVLAAALPALFGVKQ